MGVYIFLHELLCGLRVFVGTSPESLILVFIVVRAILQSLELRNGTYCAFLLLLAYTRLSALQVSPGTAPQATPTTSSFSPMPKRLVYLHCTCKLCMHDTRECIFPLGNLTPLTIFNHHRVDMMYVRRGAERGGGGYII